VHTVGYSVYRVKFRIDDGIRDIGDRLNIIGLILSCTFYDILYKYEE
jgi:hypothetical protein